MEENFIVASQCEQIKKHSDSTNCLLYSGLAGVGGGAALDSNCSLLPGISG